MANPQNLQGGYGQPGGFPAASGFGSGYGSGSSFGGSFSGSSGGAGVAPSGYGAGGPTSGGASASASIGPQGVRQMAGVFPENPVHIFTLTDVAFFVNVNQTKHISEHTECGYS